MWVRLIKNAKLGVDKEVSCHFVLRPVARAHSSPVGANSLFLRPPLVRIGRLFSARGGLVVTFVCTHQVLTFSRDAHGR